MTQSVQVVQMSHREQERRSVIRVNHLRDLSPFYSLELLRGVVKRDYYWFRGMKQYRVILRIGDYVVSKAT